ncbi:MAG: demethoxyubiquinone hydroxylase family protein [Alphaproteobacteria bacterium]
MTEAEKPRKQAQTTGEDSWPGDPDKDALVESMIRVNQAGEYGAMRIYAGQLAVLRHGPAAEKIKEMAAQERKHLDAFNKLAAERRVRPTALEPLWHLAGFALGAATALMGEKAAMACTVAVEEVIEEHYADQAAKLGEDEAPLRETIQEFRADELEHRDTAVAHHARETPGYELLASAIKAGSRLAIWLSTRV